MSRWCPLSGWRNGGLLPLTLIASLAAGCAVSAGAQRAAALKRGPLSGPPQAILRMSPVMRRAMPYTIELAIVGARSRSDLRRPIAIQLSILDGRSTTSVVTWGDPRVGRYFKWVIPAQVTADIRQPYITIHVAVHHLSGYTLTGKPIFTKPFLWAAQVVKVRHPVAGGDFDQTPNSALRYRDNGGEGLHVVAMANQRNSDR